MTDVTLETTPDFEFKLRREASREDLEPQGYILGALPERLAAVRLLSTPRLPADEATLLRELNQGRASSTVSS